MAFHLPAWFWNRQIVGLVLVHPDNPGHGGVIEPAGLGQGRLQQAELSGGDLDTLADVPGEPANLADGVPVLLTLAAHPAERRARRRGQPSPMFARLCWTAWVSGFPGGRTSSQRMAVSRNRATASSIRPAV